MSSSKVNSKRNSNRNRSNGEHNKIKAMVKVNEFNVKNYSYSDMEVSNSRSNSQMISYPRYNYGSNSSNFVYKTDWIKITQYGFPKLGEYYKDDTKRTFLKIPFDPEQQSCVDLKNMLLEIDEYNLTHKKEIFKNFSEESGMSLKKVENLYDYQPLVRKSMLDDDDEESDNKKPKRFEYCKAALKVNYNTKDIETVVYVLNKDKNVPKNERKRKLNAKTVTELEDEGVKWNAKIRFVIMLNKLWASKSRDPKTKKRTFGVTMKVLQMIAIPQKSNESIKDQFSQYCAFSEESESEEEQNEAVEKEEVVEATKEDNDGSDDSNDLDVNVKVDDGDDPDDVDVADDEEEDEVDDDTEEDPDDESEEDKKKKKKKRSRR